MNEILSTADLYDERGDELASIPLQFQDLGGRSSFSGPVRTVKCFEDNALVKTVLGTPATAPCWWWTATVRCARHSWGT